MRRHGARRRVAVLLTRVAGDDVAAARTTSQQIHERVVREIPFAEAARTYSDDPYTKVAGGDTGWHNREGSRLPEPLVEAAFADDVGVGWVSEPIETEAGFYLVNLMAIEEAPGEAMLMVRMRQEFVNDERVRMLEEAKIEFFDDA
jgi:parvulin-like peptidyl-prolyl isomerase